MKLSDFTQQVLLGKGAFGRVYRVFDPKLNRHLIIKEIQKRPQRGDVFREAKLQAESDARCVPKIYAVDEDKTKVIMAMEWIRGLTLRQLGRVHILTTADQINLSIKTARALRALHKSGLVHGDLNPENVLISTEGYAYLIDFGFGFRQNANESGDIGGTLQYTAPEIVSGVARPNIKSDIFALGAMLLELHFDMVQHEAHGIEEAIQRGEKSAASLFSQNIKKELWPILIKCIDHEPERRYQGAGEVISALEGLHFPSEESWVADMSVYFGRMIAKILVAEAESRLNKGEKSESFDLLKEAVERDPDNGKAIKLLSESDFINTSYSKQKRLIATGILIMAFVIIVALLFLKREQSVQRKIKLVREPMRIKNEPKQDGRSKVIMDIPLRSGDDSTLMGKLILDDFPQTVTLKLNGKKCGPHFRTGKLSAGSHQLDIFENDSLVAQKRFNLRPFQTLHLSFKHLEPPQ